MVAPFLIAKKIPLSEIFPRAVFLCFDWSNPPPVIRHPACDSSGDIVAVGGEEVYVLAVDKAGFDEDGEHGSVAEDAEGGMGFYAAVFVVWVKGGEGFSVR